MDTLLSGVTVVTMNPRMEVLFGAYLGVTDGKITYLDKVPPQETPKTIIDGTGMVAMPGLVNCHTHLASTVLRSLLDDSSNSEALEQLLQKMSKLDSRGAKASCLLGIAECLRFGITSVSDLSEFPEAAAEAAAQAGIRANIALAANRFVNDCEEFDFETDAQCQTLCRLADTWHGFAEDRIRIDGGIHAEYTSNYQLWESLSDYLAEKGLGLQLHLAETQAEAEDCEDRTGLTPGELLNCHRLFRVPATAAGCVALTETERKLLAGQKVSVVTTPIAYGKAGQTATAVTDCVKAGMNVALGTGGAAECGNLDLFEAMRAVAMGERVRVGDAAALPAAAVLMMATVCGARAQGRGQQCGMLEVGMDADIVLVDFSAPHLMPCHNVLNGLVFSAKGGDVAMTMVRGKILYQNGQFPTIDLQTVVAELTEYAIPLLFNQQETGR